MSSGPASLLAQTRARFPQAALDAAFIRPKRRDLAAQRMAPGRRGSPGAPDPIGVCGAEEAGTGAPAARRRGALLAADRARPRAVFAVDERQSPDRREPDPLHGSRGAPDAP